MNTAPTRILLADDQPLLRAGLRLVITEAPGLEVVGEAGNGAEAVRLAEQLRPDVVVMDLRMPLMDGIEATRRIKNLPEPPGVLVLTTFDEDENVYAALTAGAAGFLVKDMVLEDVLAAVRVVAAGDAMIAPGVTRRLIESFVARGPAPTADRRRALDGVTDRELEVLVLIGRGRSNLEIADRLHITVATAKSHVARLLTKLDARDRVQLAITAYETGLITVGS